MDGMDYLKEDVYNTERAKIRFCAEWDAVCMELRVRMGYGPRRKEDKRVKKGRRF